MAKSHPHVLVLAGGESTRTGTGGPKALLDLCGAPMLSHILTAAESLSPASRTLVLGPTHREAVEAWLGATEFAAWKVVLQPEPNGTGDAVRCGLANLPEEGEVLVLYGDTPLLRSETLKHMAAMEGGSLLTAVLPDPTGLGRVVRDEEGALTHIVEEADAPKEILEIREVNAGVYLLDLARLRAEVAELGTDNAQQEFYLTDAALAVLSETGGSTLTLEDSPEEILGVNTLDDLCTVSAVMRDRILSRHLSQGVIISDALNTYIEDGVSIGAGTQILPFTVLRRGVKVGRNCMVGPFAHLRGDTVLGDGAQIGNFVEVKNGQVGAGAKAKHLTYLGDVSVGNRANIGAGTITANYDGRNKHRTEIGEKAFIGSGTVLVAPVRIGARATTGAGAVVTRNRDVPDDTTVVGVPAHPISSPASKTD